MTSDTRTDGDSGDRVADELEAALDRANGLTAEYAREWQQFACWAVAHGHSPLPASAATLLAYLDAYPGALTTQRGRASAITAAPTTTPATRSHHPRSCAAGRAAVPGRSRSRAPDPAARDPATPGQRAVTGRAERLAKARADLEPRIALLPVTGWPPHSGDPAAFQRSLRGECLAAAAHQKQQAEIVGDSGCGDSAVMADFA